MPLFSTPTWKAIEYAGDTGLNDYPIFDEDYRAYLNQRILEHYDEQEIGLENPIMWVFALRRKMFEIMPRYNKLYLTERLVIDPTQSINLKTVFDGMSNTDASNVATRNSESDSNGTSSQTNKTDSVTNNRARTTNSVMPQVRLSGNKDYATNGSDVVSGVDSDVNVNDNIINNAKTVDHDSAKSDTKAKDTSHTENVVTGHDRPIGEIVAQYRTTFLNIEEMIIADLGELFMLLWNTSDAYERRF